MRARFEIEPRLFELLLSTWQSLETLHFENVHLEPERLEMMAKHFVNAKYLSLQDDRLRDFSFITKFPNLLKITLNFNLVRDVLRFFCDHLRSTWQTVELESEHQRIEFKKRKQFWLEICKYD